MPLHAHHGAAQHASGQHPAAPIPQAFFADDKARGRSFAELYELVQHAGNMLPRLCALPRCMHFVRHRGGEM